MMSLVLLSSAVLCVLAVAVELAARARIRMGRAYYVFPPGLRLRLCGDGEQRHRDQGESQAPLQVPEHLELLLVVYALTRGRCLHPAAEFHCYLRSPRQRSHDGPADMGVLLGRRGFL